MLDAVEDSSGKLVAASVASYSSTRETGYELYQRFFQPSALAQSTILTTERRWKIIPANSSYGRGSLPTAISKIFTRGCVIVIKNNDNLVQQFVGTRQAETAESVRKTRARDFSEEDWLRLIHEGSSKTRFGYCEDSKNSLAYFPATQGHSVGTTIALEFMVHILVRYDWKEFVFHSVVPSAFNPSLRRNTKQQGTTDHLLHNSQPLRGNPHEEAPSDDFTIHKKVHYHNNWKRNQDAVDWTTLSRAEIKECESGRRNRNNRTRSCASRLHLPSNLSNLSVAIFAQEQFLLGRYA